MLGAPNICQAGFGFEIHKMAVTGKFDSALLQITVVATGVEVSDYQQGCRIKILRKFKTLVEESRFLVQLGEIAAQRLKVANFASPSSPFSAPVGVMRVSSKGSLAPTSMALAVRFS